MPGISTNINDIYKNISNFNIKELTTQIKQKGPIVPFAAITLGAMAAAYYAPGKTILATLSLASAQFLALPYLLENSDQPLYRTTLSASFAAFGALTLACSTFFSYQAINFSQVFIQSTTAHQTIQTRLQSILIGSTIISALVGYGIPMGYGFMKKAYSIFTDVHSKEKLNYLANFLQTHPMAKGFFESIENRFQLAKAVIFPESLINNMRNHRYSLRSVITAYTFSHKPDLFKQAIHQLEMINTLINLIPPAARVQLNQLSNLICEDLRFCLAFLPQEQLEHAVGTLRDKAAQLIPNVISKAKFLDLWQGKALEELHHKSQQFIDQLCQLDKIENKYAKLEEELTELNKHLEETITKYKDSKELPKELEKLNDQLVAISQKSSQELKAVENLCREKQRLNALLNLYTDEELAPKMALIPILRAIIADDTVMNKLQAMYRDATSTDQNQIENNPNVIARVTGTIRRLSNRLATLNEDTNTPAWLYLGASCQFVTRDYEDMKEWLEIHELGEIEEKLEELGLKTQHDLYRHGILKEETQLSKEEIKVRLKAYIQARLKGDVRTRIYSFLSSFHPSKSTLHLMSQRITKHVYQMAIRGMILVPVILYPRASTAGAAFGGTFGIFMHFNLFYTNTLAGFISKALEYSNERGFIDIIRVSTIGAMIQVLRGRRLFNLTPANERSRAIFVESSFFDRVRILNTELFLTCFVAFARFSNYSDEPGGVGGFFQGLALGLESSKLGIEAASSFLRKHKFPWLGQKAAHAF